ncbi:MAG: CapA family protein [Holophagales bacterium]|jgi:poly-gamma-glutamate synthesis protein (capsule biosynthesis protein)|nr:CapA family protein [Holophagales bacterium]
MGLWRKAFNVCTWIICLWLVSLVSTKPYKGQPLKFPSPPAPIPAHIDITIVAVGDLISHQDVQSAALKAENGWASLWEEVTPLFKQADLAMANLETPIAPKTGRPGIPFCFNAPSNLASALKETGVGLVFTANNHAFDQSVKGVAETLEHLDANDIKYAGSGLSRDAAESPVIMELRDGVRVAVLARTDIFNNNLNQRPDRPWVAALDADGTERTIREIRSQVDLIMISVHWGNEYETLPNKRQRESAARLIAAGADVLIGHHPHVLQPFEWIDSGGRRGAVAFSLGNFLSNQDRMYDPSAQPLSSGDSRDGGALVLTLRKDSSGVRLRDAYVEPLWTDNNWIQHTKGQNAKRIIRVLRTTPGERGADMEDLLSKRRSRALDRLRQSQNAGFAATSTELTGRD